MLGYKKIGIIGGGFMAEALIQGIGKAGIVEMKNMTVSDVREDRLAHLSERYGVITGKDNSRAVIGTHVLILAVKPQVLPGVLTEIGGYVGANMLVISIAAGVQMAAIANYIHGKLARAMPNMCVQVGEGMTALCFNQHVDRDDVEMAKTLFSAVGETIVVEESLMDAVTALSGSGPAYMFLVMEALIEAGVACGLSMEQSRKLALQTAKGAAAMALSSGEHPAVLKGKVMSPAGTTVEALAVLENHGVRGAFIEAVKAAWRRSKGLA